MDRRAHSPSFLLALISGVMASLVLTAMWGYISYLTGYQIGWMAVAIGYLIGFTVQYIGKGSTPAFALLGASLALLTCILGNLLIGCLQISSVHNIALPVLLPQITFDLALSILKDLSSPTDLLFYGLAIYNGHRFSVAPPFEEPSISAT